ncbi:MAG: HEPN domain-containing protein, partial [Candidatus Lindowbacteria bacterium]|nr:HEPN domain-containing protein [Candidatus Lindowbacteria bacterium]
MRPPDEVKEHIVRQWLWKAEADMDAAEDLLSGERLSYYPSCFHSQQAAEKLLKAFLTWHQIEFPKTHIFGELLDLISPIDRGLADSIKDVTKLNPYGVEVRYPGDIPEPSRAQAEDALMLARVVRDAI